MCAAFSNIQNLNKAKRDAGVVKAEINKARFHLAWYTFSTNTPDEPPPGKNPTSGTSYAKTA